MAKKRIHRVGVYLLDSDRRRILLCKDSRPEAKNSQFNVPVRNLQPTQTPLETVRQLIRDLCGLEIRFISHSTAMAEVLDHVSVKMPAPLFVQVICASPEIDFVDYVFLAQASKHFEFSEGGDVAWFHSEDLIGSITPRRVKRLCRFVLTMMNPS